MSKNALSILNDATTLNKFKEEAKKQACNFDIYQIVPQYEAIYEATIKKCMVL